MTRYGEVFYVSEYMLDIIATYMDDEIRERTHNEVAPCDPEYFLRCYVNNDPDFEDFLQSEFGIEIDGKVRTYY